MFSELHFKRGSSYSIATPESCQSLEDVSEARYSVAEAFEASYLIAEPLRLSSL